MPVAQFPLRDEVRSHRRGFLAASASLAAAALWAGRSSTALGAAAKFVDYPFQLGVASGDPAADGFVIWTRLAPQPLVGGGMPHEAVEVGWQVADDEKFERVVRAGTVAARPEWGHSVHVEVDGLRPDRWYWYRFRAGGEISPTGRARTFPAVDAAAANLRFAFASCQHYESGLFTAYEHIAQDDLDLVVHLGDYIYEGAAAKENRVRFHVGLELDSLDDYRNRHAQYKTDRHLQATHAAFPWLVTWDDHEFDNNCAGSVSEEMRVQPAAYVRRRARAYQAYYEHMPLRRSSLPQGPNMQLYRRAPFGGLADFFVLDTRQYRTDQPCGDGNKPQCQAALGETGTLLGDAQERWLCDGLAASTARWNILAQQVMMARVDRAAGASEAFSMDQWPGYEANRRRLLKFLHDRQIKNAVTIAGDIHTNWANDLIADFDDLDSAVVATEFVGTSISSGGNGVKEPKFLAETYAENPFVKFHNAERGFVRCQVTPQTMTAQFQVVEDIQKPGAPLLTRATFAVEAGRPGVQRS